MSAYYDKRDGSLEAYYTRLIGAICAQNGGEFRVKGELVDTAGEVAKFVMGWDKKTQEVVIRDDLAFVQVIRVMPREQTSQEVIAADPLRKEKPEEPNLFNAKGSTLDNEKLAQLETALTKKRVAALISEDLKRRRQPEV